MHGTIFTCKLNVHSSVGVHFLEISVHEIGKANKSEHFSFLFGPSLLKKSSYRCPFIEFDMFRATCAVFKRYFIIIGQIKVNSTNNAPSTKNKQGAD